MMLNLIKKDLKLSMHPTSYIFLGLACLVFVPNYPYEVIFFFSTLSTFFVCLSSRENGDYTFSVALPIKKENVPLARIIVTVCLQISMMLLVGALGAIKCAVMQDMIINEVGLSANLTLVGNGALMLGVFNVIFFTMHFKKPSNVGLPFVSGVVSLFLLMSIFIVLRHVTNLYGVILNGSNSENTFPKAISMLVGIVAYVVLTIVSVKLSQHNFKKVDL